MQYLADQGQILSLMSFPHVLRIYIYLQNITWHVLIHHFLVNFGDRYKESFKSYVGKYLIYSELSNKYKAKTYSFWEFPLTRFSPTQWKMTQNNFLFFTWTIICHFFWLTIRKTAHELIVHDIILGHYWCHIITRKGSL